MEDAIVLAKCLSGTDDGPMALRTYEAKRRERTAAIQAAMRSRFIGISPSRSRTFSPVSPRITSTVQQWSALEGYPVQSVTTMRMPQGTVTTSETLTGASPRPRVTKRCTNRPTSIGDLRTVISARSGWRCSPRRRRR